MTPWNAMICNVYIHVYSIHGVIIGVNIGICPSVKHLGAAAPMFLSIGRGLSIIWANGQKIRKG